MVKFVLRKNLGKFFWIIVFQFFIWRFTLTIKQWDKNYYINFSSSFFIIGTIMLCFISLLSVPLIVVCQFAVLFFISYMDYKVKEVYSLWVFVYLIISISLSVLNIKNHAFSILLGLIFFLFSFVKMYAYADGIVLFGLVQSIAFMKNSYFTESIVCFIAIHYSIGIIYLVNCFFKKKRIVPGNTIPMLPFVTIVFYMWMIVNCLFY